MKSINSWILNKLRGFIFLTDEEIIDKEKEELKRLMAKYPEMVRGVYPFIPEY